jgi:hypothetical protein
MNDEAVDNTMSGVVAGNLVQAGHIDKVFLAHDVPVTDDGQPPLVVTVTKEDTGDDQPLWFVDCAIEQVPAYGGPEWDEWISTHQLTADHYDRLNLRVEGTSPQAVVLERMRFRVVERTPPRAVALSLVNHIHSSAMMPRCFGVDLSYGTEKELVPQGVPDFPYRVHQSDPEWFVVELYGVEDGVAWVVELDWLCAGQSGTLRIDDGGQPFRSMTAADRSCYCWDTFRPERGWQPDW